jgi:hypothetical protein
METNEDLQKRGEIEEKSGDMRSGKIRATHLNPSAGERGRCTFR